MWGRPRPADAAPKIPEITPAQLLAELAAATPPLLIDVRSPAEFAGGHIAESRLMPLPTLGSHVPEIPAGQPVVCVCRAGHRSATAAEFLGSHGRPARSLAGGMLAWKGPVVTGPGTASRP